jgi:MFS family permease
VNYFRFFLANRRILSFGILMVFFSSFGQTYVLSLYIPWLLESFSISRSFFSGMYALATLLSGSVLVFAGRKIDHVPLKHFTLFVIIGILIANLVAAFSIHLLLLFLAIFLLRFFGQGLLSHTAMTTMARYFNKARGKALSIAFVGFPLGEGVFPVAIIGAILWLGWRETFAISAVAIALILFPLAIWLLKDISERTIVDDVNDVKKSYNQIIPTDERIWHQGQILKSRSFYLFAPTVFLVGFLQTALFFFQTFIAAEKGWSVEWMAGSITAYAAAAFMSSMLSGPLIDRFTAMRIFPFVLIPLGLGLSVLGVFSHPMFALVYWFLVGLSGGMSSPVASSLYAEVYGTRSLGTVRSLFTFVMIVSTAMGPLVYSFLLDMGFVFSQIHWSINVVILMNVIFILFLRK